MMEEDELVIKEFISNKKKENSKNESLKESKNTDCLTN
jgi:hypothetical protein